MNPSTTSPPAWRIARLGPLAAAVLVLGACAGGALVGPAPSEPAPQIVKLGARDAQGRDYMIWDRPSSFGPVPPALRAVGDLSCMRSNLQTRAEGYHPAARGLDGRTLPGGGFFCQLPVRGRSAAVPRVVKVGDHVGWDLPGNFGPIPEGLLERGRRDCEARQPGSQPLGYHPAPLGEDGRPIANGGFLCLTP
jgi:hypothetical protein